jgi:hypothetical protein
MTTEEIRDIGFLRWRDPLAWMESMKGFQWQRMVKKENLRFTTAIQMLSTEEQLQHLQKQFQLSKEKHTLQNTFRSGDVIITNRGMYDLVWHWKGEKERNACVLVSENDTCWCIEDDKEGREIYSLVCYKKGVQSAVWKKKLSVGPFLAVQKGLCYVVEATGELQYRKLICIDSLTGKTKKVLFEEKSLRHNLYLFQKERGCIFLISENSGRQRLYHVEGMKVNPLCSQGVAFFPIGYGPKGDVCYFAREDSFSSPWKAFGATVKQWMIPKELRMDRIILVSLHHKIFCTLSAGQVSIYECRGGISPRLRCSYYGILHADTHAIQECREDIPCIATSLGCYPVLNTLPHWKDISSESYAATSSYFAKSKDGTQVPFLLVNGSQQKGLLCIAYGAYNIPSNLNLIRWKPYLDSGWVLCFAMVRGGGDRGDQWAEDARRDKKYKSIEDVESVLRAAQRITGLPPKKTCLYGRSAGGYIVGAICSHHPNGDLIGAAYAEVPYVDILRTTTNPTLPLTILEYDEFGNPAEKIEDLQTILRLSPVDSLPPEGAPGIFVVAITSVNDREVLTYECVKWIIRLRGFPETRDGSLKFLRILENQGHFVKGQAEFRQRAEDFLLLSSFLYPHKK